MASQTQFDGHVRETAGTGGAASEIDDPRLTDSGVIAQAEFAAIKGKRGRIGEGRRNARRRGPPIPSVARAHLGACERCRGLTTTKEFRCFPDC